MVKVELDEITDEDLGALMKALAKDPEKVELKDLILGLAEARLQLWRDGEMLLVTSLNKTKKGLKLFILWVVGKGWFKGRAKFEATIRAMAKSQGCYAIGGVTSRPGLQALYTGLGATEILREYELEI